MAGWGRGINDLERGVWVGVLFGILAEVSVGSDDLYNNITYAVLLNRYRVFIITWKVSPYFVRGGLN